MCVCLGEEAAAGGPGGGAVAQGVPVRAPEFSAHTAVPRRARKGADVVGETPVVCVAQSVLDEDRGGGARMGRACSRRRGNALRWAVRWAVGAGVSWASVRSARPALMSSGRTCDEAVAGSQGVGQRGLCRVGRARPPAGVVRLPRLACRVGDLAQSAGEEGGQVGGGDDAFGGRRRGRRWCRCRSRCRCHAGSGSGRSGLRPVAGSGGQGALVPVPPLVHPVLGHEYCGQRRPGSALRTPR